ncbi:MAG TPA: sulfatase-like hydrolase/transferase [Planctomycetota bacterium]|nr:sulfatase-like hydrolase/transferase [Planctomycetota bacterium]
MRASTILIAAFVRFATLAALAASIARAQDLPPARADTPPSPKPSIVLFTLDTTRADHLGCYGCAAAKTPRLDALAKSAVRFESARTTCPITLPAHSSMMTGLAPFRHGVRDNAGFRLDEAHATLAELLHAAGYATAGFVASTVLGRASGIAQGFDVFEEPKRGTAAEMIYPSLRAPEVNARVRAWLARRDPARPFFLWVHYYDPHAPYEPPPEFAAGAATPYDGEISAVDAAVGEVLDALAEIDRDDRLLTIVTADHGEGLGFRGEATHSIYLYEPLVRVPLLVKWPGGPAGAVRADAVSGVDVFPTVLEAAGVAAPLDSDGVSLSKPGSADRHVYCESLDPWLNHGWSPLFAWAGRDLEYFHSTAPELYAATPSHLEGEDLAAARPDDVARLAAGLKQFVEERAALGPALAGSRVALTPERRAELTQLGYVGIDAGDVVLPEPFALDPKLPRATAERLERFTRATTPRKDLTLEASIAEMQAILADEPGEIAVLDALGRALILAKRGRDGAKVLQQLLRLRPNHADAWSNLGACHQLEKEFDAAIACYQRSLELDPNGPGALTNLAACLKKVGRNDEAAAIRKRLEAQRK